MILDSDRLLTSLPFYDNIDKQEANRKRSGGQYWDLRVDTWTLKPFQIKTGMACGSITICNLIDDYGNSTDLLADATYNIDEAIDIKTDGTNYWIIFDGSLSQEIQTGHYYIEIGDCFHIWYSEWFYACRLCKNPSKMYNNTKKMEYMTAKRGMATQTIIGISTLPQLYYYNGKTYGCWLQRVGTSYNAESMVYAINHSECSISQSYGVGYELPGALDHHAQPSIIVADDGHIVVAHEHQRAASGSHNDEIIIKRSDEAEDETLWINAIAQNVNYYTTVGNSTTERLSYQHLYKTSNGNIWLFARQYIAPASTGDHKLKLYKSTNNAQSFASGVDVVDFAGAVNNTANWIYPSQPARGTTDRIDIIINRRDGDKTGSSTGVYTDLYYMISDDGITWTDVAGNGSKNVVSAGALNETELDANHYLVHHGKIYMRTFCLDENGKVYILGDDYSGGKEIVLYEYSNNTWNAHKPNVPYTINQATIVYRGAGILDVYINSGGSTSPLMHYRIDPDDYTKWFLLETVYTPPERYDGNNFTYGGYTFNHNDTSLNTLAGVLSTTNYANLFLQFDSDGKNDISVLKWWNEVDNFDIIYQYGFKNYLYLDKEVLNQEWETIKEGSQRDGKYFVTKVVTKKSHSIVVLAPEYVADMCNLIESHSDIYIIDSLGQEHEVKEINVETTKFNEWLWRISINMYVNPTYSANCTTNKVLT